jgi:hypothetical protein
MREILAFFVLSIVKIISHLFYPLELKWITPKEQINWKNVRVLIFLNHTSLYEPLFSQALPFKFLWTFAHKMRAPGADKTLNRPIVGKIWKLMNPRMSSITRKKDDTWSQFMQMIEPDAVVIIAPEGRMKRPNGLDVSGKPMSVRGGIADIITAIPSGDILICYSGGLHHVQQPGQMIPKIFKKIKMNFEVLDIEKYRNHFQTTGKELKLDIVKDLQKKLETNCPK